MNPYFLLPLTALCLIGIVPLCVGALSLLVAGRARNQSPAPPALLFHSISVSAPRHFSHVSRSRFAEFCEALHRRQLRAVPVAQWRNKPNPGNSVIFAFDDGFEDFLFNACPVLSRYGWHASVFPVVEYIGKPSCWDVFGHRIHLTWEMLRDIVQMGHEIGSHGLTHADMTRLSDAELRRELADSKARIEDALGIEAATFSFPFGSWNKRTVDSAREAGYRACTVYRSPARATGDIIGVRGAYAFDTVHDLLCRLFPERSWSHAIARGRIMPHFAKGAPLWRFRKTYRLSTD
jgi:peptidoglycan/xylan/chitin deacetylase (PgdA/CDA1 family)